MHFEVVLKSTTKIAKLLLKALNYAEDVFWEILFYIETYDMFALWNLPDEKPFIKLRLQMII